MIGLILQGFVRVGLEADQPDCDRVSTDQGFLIGRSRCDRSDQGQLRGPNSKMRTIQPTGIILTGIRCNVSFSNFFGCHHPDSPILAFFDFLAFLVFRFPLLFCAFFLSFPRILGVPRREKTLLISGFPLLFPKSKGWRVRGTKFVSLCFEGHSELLLNFSASTQESCHINNTTATLIHYGGGKK